MNQALKRRVIHYAQFLESDETIWLLTQSLVGIPQQGTSLGCSSQSCLIFLMQ